MYIAYLCWPDHMLADVQQGEDYQRFLSLPDEALQSIKDYSDAIDRGEAGDDVEPCIWFDEQTRQCKWYEHRPDICRDEVTVNDEYCIRWREVYADTIETKPKAAGRKLVRLVPNLHTQNL